MGTGRKHGFWDEPEAIEPKGVRRRPVQVCDHEGVQAREEQRRGEEVGIAEKVIRRQGQVALIISIVGYAVDGVRLRRPSIIVGAPAATCDADLDSCRQGESAVGRDQQL